MTDKLAAALAELESEMDDILCDQCQLDPELEARRPCLNQERRMTANEIQFRAHLVELAKSVEPGYAMSLQITRHSAMGPQTSYVPFDIAEVGSELPRYEDAKREIFITLKREIKAALAQASDDLMKLATGPLKIE